MLPLRNGQVRERHGMEVRGEEEGAERNWLSWRLCVGRSRHGLAQRAVSPRAMRLGIAMQRAARRGDCSDGVLETGDATRSQDHSECEVRWPLLRGAYKGVCSVAHENAR